MDRKKIIRTLLISLAVLMIGVLAWQYPIPQNPDYHIFSDNRRLFGIPNFWNTVSNLAFIIPFFYGMRILEINSSQSMLRYERVCYQFLLAGFLLTCLGSSWYHWEPSTESLFWDRLPMVLIFGPFYTLVLHRYFPEYQIMRLFPWIIIASVGSVVYWKLGESYGYGDLSAYAFVQFYPMVSILILLIGMPDQKNVKSKMWQVIILYGAAKFAEYQDLYYYVNIYISGHTIKHILAAIAGIFMMQWILEIRKTPLPSLSNN